MSQVSGLKATMPRSAHGYYFATIQGFKELYKTCSKSNQAPLA
jgi:hypothetical protein